MFVCEVDDAIDVAFEWWALDPVSGEQLLRLARIVELPDKKVRHSVMWETRDSW